MYIARYTHTHTHTYIHIYLCIYICVDTHTSQSINKTINTYHKKYLSWDIIHYNVYHRMYTYITKFMLQGMKISHTVYVNVSK